jgi:hypothetical protein
LIYWSFDAATVGIVASLFPAPIVLDYGLLPILVGFGAVALLVVALTRVVWATNTTSKKPLVWLQPQGNDELPRRPLLGVWVNS